MNSFAESFHNVGNTPLEKGSVSLRLYASEGMSIEQVNQMRSEARLAEGVGYDGVMVSEHHAGFPGYLPNPLQLSSFLLPATLNLWVSPCPLLLPTKPKAMLAEEIAWLSSAYPNRVGVGFAAGALPVDFELAEVPFGEKNQRFKSNLPWIVDTLRGLVEGPIGNDLAVRQCKHRPIPMVVAAQSKEACMRAAKLNLGILFDSLQSPEASMKLASAYREAGGDGPVILIRRVWIGSPPTAKIRAQMEHYHSYASARAKGNWTQGDGTVVASNGEEAAEQLLKILDNSGCDTVNIRVHVAGLDSEEISEQIKAHEDSLVPALKSGLRVD